MKTIIHISNDYPDILVPQKTKAVKNLVDGTPEYRHIVYSLNRVDALSGIASMAFGDDRIAVAYGALPKGIWWEKRLPEVAQWILKDLSAKGITPDLIEAHKFTIEGVIGYHLAKSFNVPLICDIMGYSDVNILKKKKSMRGVYQDIAHYSAAFFPYAPWTLDEFNKMIPLDKAKCTCLPVVPFVDEMKAAPIITDDKILSVFHLDGWKNKNFEGMAQAVKALLPNRPHLTLDVYGGGSPKTLIALQKIIDTLDISKHVRLMGPVENGAMPEIMQKYAAFVMPSKSESYGLVYIEALFSGLPVLFNAKRAIAGYYEAGDIGYGCDPLDSGDIANGIVHMLDHQKSLKECIAKMQKDGAFEQLRKGAILQQYKAVIDSVLESEHA